jgi:dihydroneopterin aldolase
MDGTPGSIGLRALRCSAQQGQPPTANLLLVDVTIQFDLTAVAQSDSYDDVVDLADLADFVRASIAARTWVLLETIAINVGRAVLQRYAMVRSVQMRVVKPNPPGLDAAEEFVEVHVE